MITRRQHRRVRRTNNKLRAEREQLALTVRALSGNPMKETERQAIAKRQKFLENLKGSVEERFAKSLEQIEGLEERIATLPKVPRIVRWFFRAV